MYRAQRRSHWPPQPQRHLYGSGGGTCSVPGSRGPASSRNSFWPPTLLVSREAPWKAPHIETVLNRPVAARARRRAIPMAALPPGQKSDFPRSPGVISASFFAREIAGALVYRRGGQRRAASLAFFGWG